MDLPNERFTNISMEEAVRLLEESKQTQRLLEQKIRELQSQSMAKDLSTSKENLGEEFSSQIGPFDISQTGSDTIVIRGMGLEDCRDFLRDYLGQGEHSNYKSK